MAHYTLPVFNLIANIWRFGNATSNPPDVVTVCNLAAGRRVLSLPGGFDGPGASIGAMLLLLPKSTDVQDSKNGIGPDTVECPAGTQRFYVATWVDDFALGFGNEHRFAQLTWGGVSWPTPFPADSPPPPHAPSLLLESGGYLLLESGGTILLE